MFQGFLADIVVTAEQSNVYPGTSQCRSAELDGGASGAQWSKKVIAKEIDTLTKIKL